MANLSDRIKELMTDLGIDQSTLAKWAGVSDQAVSQWILGESKCLKAKTAFAIQRRSGWSAEYLTLGTGPKKIAEIREESLQYAIKQKIDQGEIINLSDLDIEQRHAIQSAVKAIRQLLPKKS